MEMVSVRLVGIWKSFNTEWVLKDINLDVSEGELLVILGPSGSGKTTTLRIIAGLLEPNKGKVLFDNTDVTNMEAAERNVGFVFQSLALFPHMTVWENIAFGLEVKDYPKDQIRKRVKELIEFLDLSGLESRYPRELSGGQRQRVAIARALAPNPELLLLDEPFANLDEPLRDKLRWEFKRLQKKFGITTIFVTHDQSEAFQIADSIAILIDGRILWHGKPEEIYEKPLSLEVAKFLRLNILEINRKENIFSEINENILPCKVDSNYVGIWPKDIIIGEGKLEAQILACNFQRNYWRVLLRLKDDQIIEAITSQKMKEGISVSIRIKKCIPLK